jgi:hypothetical protein
MRELTKRSNDGPDLSDVDRVVVLVVEHLEGLLNSLLDLLIYSF